MYVLKAYLNDRNQATIVCISCGKAKMINAAQVNHNAPVKARCSCGFVFQVSFEKRDCYRKLVSLAGEFSKDGWNKECGSMNVEDISRGGIGFKTQFKNSLQVGDIIKVRFCLDDPHMSQISKTMVVKRVDGHLIGAEFCNHDIGKALAFYLMP